MKYPNLGWTIDHRRFAHYQVANAAHMNPSRFSRCANGLAHFSQAERERIASFLQCPESWLFEEIRPPRSVYCPDVDAASA